MKSLDFPIFLLSMLEHASSSLAFSPTPFLLPWLMLFVEQFGGWLLHSRIGFVACLPGFSPILNNVISLAVAASFVYNSIYNRQLCNRYWLQDKEFRVCWCVVVAALHPIALALEYAIKASRRCSRSKAVLIPGCIASYPILDNHKHSFMFVGCLPACSRELTFF